MVIFNRWTAMNHNFVFLYSFFFLFFSYTNAMELADTLRTPGHFPQELSEMIVWHQLRDVHNQVVTIPEARDYLMSVSLVNKKYHKIVNDPLVTRDIIQGLRATLRHSGGRM